MYEERERTERKRKKKGKLTKVERVTEPSWSGQGTMDEKDTKGLNQGRGG